MAHASQQKIERALAAAGSLRIDFGGRQILLDRLFHCRRRGVALARAFADRAQHQMIDFLVEIFIAPRRRRERLVADLVDDLEGVRAGYCGPAHQHLIEHHAGGKHIGDGSRRFVAQAFRRHITRRAHDAAGGGGLTGGRGDAEIHDAGRAAGINHDIGRLDIAVDHLLGVRVGEALGDLDGEA